MLMTAALFVSYAAAPAVADWQPGDGHKMHFPQTPNIGGWDVEFAASRLADDWMCTETDTVTDIHFWVSWYQNLGGDIPGFSVAIYPDLPVGHPDNTYPYSVPDYRQVLYYHDFVPGEFTQRLLAPDMQGWWDPSNPLVYELDNHDLWHQINLFDVQSYVDPPFVQDSGSIYWLEIDFGTLPHVGWKESDQHFNDAAIFYWDTTRIECRDPITGGAIDLAFVITGTGGPPPGEIPTLSEWGLIIFCLLLFGWMTWAIAKRRRAATLET
jgi:hypothetical protein